MKTINYYITTRVDGENKLEERQGKEFKYKDLTFGLTKNGRFCIVTELTTGLKVNCLRYNPKTYKEAVELFTEDFYNIIKTVMEYREMLPSVKELTYIVRDRFYGNKISEFATLTLAREELEKYKTKDKQNGTDEEHFYEIAQWNKDDDTYITVE